MERRGLVVFDLDGTLVDSEKAFHAAVRDYSAQNSLPSPDMDAIMHGYAEPMQHDFGWGVGREEQTLHFRNAAFIFDNPATNPAYTPALFPLVHETLAKLKLRYYLAVATARPASAISHIFDTDNLHGYFDAVRGAEDVKGRGLKLKPAPDMLLDLMREFGAGPADTYMVGDTVMDMRMAKTAGAHAVAVDWGYHKPEALLSVGIDHMLTHDISRLEHILDETRKNP